MKHAMIDIGSNSMRLTLYDTDGVSFKILFKEKIMAGLAGYVKDGAMSDEGIACACDGLLAFKDTLSSLGIEAVNVFATASLRNISNTQEAVAAIKSATDYSVEVLSGEEEAELGYTGAMRELRVDSGAFVDVGGASTEIVTFDHAVLEHSESFPVGSLGLYRDCVKKILPGDGALRKMEKIITAAIVKNSLYPFDQRSPLVCVGGTARAALKLAQTIYSLPKDRPSITAQQFTAMCDQLFRGGREAAELILRQEPDRIHTIIPGLMILQKVLELFRSEEIIISKYGVREDIYVKRFYKLCRAVSLYAKSRAKLASV